MVGDVGRQTIRLGLTNETGALRRDTVRAYPGETQSTISGALSTFTKEAGLAALPRRFALAISGAPRGDTISVTNSRWYVSRSGLRAMLQCEPLILNDFAAIAWSLSSAKSSARIETIDLGAISPATKPGTYAIIGIGSGLGVAVLQRDEFGHFSVLATEAGHCSFTPTGPEWQSIVEIMRRGVPCQTGEHLMSAAGLQRSYLACCEAMGAPPRAASSVEVIHLAETVRDAPAVKATDLIARALWQFASNMVLSYGAWDGVILTGSLTQALAKTLRQPGLREQFCLPGPFARQLNSVPRSFASFDHGELEGAAQALLLRDRALANSAMDAAA
ncbi:MAG TPA: glucokinase [Sphingomonas sp.]|nr:glucokinase [Sphingomonas sp.]